MDRAHEQENRQAGEQMPDRDVNERLAGGAAQLPYHDENEHPTGGETTAAGSGRENSGAAVQKAVRREAAGMRRKQKRARANSIFWTVSLTVGVLLFSLVFVVSKHKDELDCKERLVTTFEFFKTQTSAYSKYNDTAVAKSLVRESAAVHALERDCTLDASEAELQQYTETLWMTGIALLDPTGSLISEYTEDGVGYDAIRDGLPEIASLGLVDAPDKTYVKRVELRDGSFVDVALHAFSTGDGILLAYRHTKEAFAQKSVLSMQTLLNGYDMNTVGTFLLVRSNVVEASNDPAMIGVDVTSHAMLRRIRATNQSEKLTYVVDERGAKYYGMYTHGRDFVLYAYVPAQNIYRSMMPNLAAMLILYIVMLAVVQGLRWNAEQKYRQREAAAEHAYKEALEKKNHELEIAVQQEAAANRAKRDFLFNMSHDIRTPMNAIIGYTTLAETNLTQPVKVADYLRKISTASQHLLSLINDVLDMSRIESGRVVLEQKPVHLPTLVQDVQDIIQSNVTAKGLSFAVDLAGVRDEDVVADALRLQRILLNILSNAVKFTPSGGSITLRVVEKSSTDAPVRCGEYEFHVRDTGIGMSAEYQKHIYEQFSREETSTVSKTEGTGLGMPITKRLVEMMDGSIDLLSVQGHGTEFTVHLRLPLCGAPKLETPVVDPEFAGMRLLVVEDNELNMEITTTVLEEAGFVVDQAVNGQAALEKIATAAPGQYALVLMDIQMPVMDGYEATRRIRALPDPAKAQIPIVAMTANAFAEDRENALAAGMNEHIAKPFDIHTLLWKLAEILKK
ncbi:MAG: response regulator [Oribacterium sp.]|nr:response regulator [Oribacterium sp.]